MKDYIQNHYGHVNNPLYNRLRDIVNKAWEAITVEQLQDLMSSMQQRCIDVIEAEGGYTKWWFFKSTLNLNSTLYIRSILYIRSTLYLNLSLISTPERSDEISLLSDAI